MSELKVSVVWDGNRQFEIKSDEPVDLDIGDRVYTATPTTVRKPVQLLSTDQGIVALCDDGTMWFSIDGEDVWRSVAGIPQVDV